MAEFLKNTYFEEHLQTADNFEKRNSKKPKILTETLQHKRHRKIIDRTTSHELQW